MPFSQKIYSYPIFFKSMYKATCNSRVPFSWGILYSHHPLLEHTELCNCDRIVQFSQRIYASPILCPHYTYPVFTCSQLFQNILQNETKHGIGSWDSRSGFPLPTARHFLLCSTAESWVSRADRTGLISCRTFILALWRDQNAESAIKREWNGSQSWRMSTYRKLNSYKTSHYKLRTGLKRLKNGYIQEDRDHNGR